LLLLLELLHGVVMASRNEGLVVVVRVLEHAMVLMTSRTSCSRVLQGLSGRREREVRRLVVVSGLVVEVAAVTRDRRGRCRCRWRRSCG
jgi:hypothetical protein